MVNEHALTVSLEEFGLSNYEARAYVTLVAKGTISASELAYYSELPRTKVYPILLKLEKKKLAIISKSKPRMCTAIAPEDAFDDVVQEQINKVNAMNTLVTNLKKVSEDSKKSRGAVEKRYFDLSANAVLNQLRTMVEGSKSSIHIIVDQWGLGLLAECKDQMLTVLRRDLEVKIIIPPSLLGSESIKAVPDGAKIRISDIIQNCFIFDETELMLIDSNNGKGATFSSTEILGVNQMKIFSHVWKNALRTDSLYDMTKTEAQEIYRMIRLINENALGHILNATLVSKTQDIDMLKF
ncbi:MAG: TrmB family transcriptional regulator, partial [Nitrosopumilaceae archaeon]